MKNVIKNIIERVHVCGADHTQLEVVIWSISYITRNWNDSKTIDQRYIYVYYTETLFKNKAKFLLRHSI